eukprot:5406631-Amphidinium_carterae.1
MSRMRLRFSQQLEMGGAPQGFVSERPWNFIWKAVVDDPFWQTQVREPALLILNGSTSMAALIGGDAPTRASSNKPSSHAQASAIASAPVATAQTSATAHTSASNRAQKPRRHHVVDETGLHRVNRRGIPLCKGFQDGSCTAIQEGTRVVCKANSGYLHQCAKCLQIGHGASSCPNPPAPKPFKGQGKGKGKSAGPH